MSASSTMIGEASEVDQSGYRTIQDEVFVESAHPRDEAQPAAALPLISERAVLLGTPASSGDCAGSCCRCGHGPDFCGCAGGFAAEATALSTAGQHVARLPHGTRNAPVVKACG